MALTLDRLEKWYEQTVKLKCAFAGETPPEPIPLPDVTNIDGLLEGIAEQSEEAFVAAAQGTGHYHNYDVAYKLQLPADLKRWYGLKKIGGGTIVFNQVNNMNSTNPDVVTSYGVTFTFDRTNLTCTCSDTATGLASVSRSYTAVAGHAYLLTGCPANGSDTTFYQKTSTSGNDHGQGIIYTETTSGTRYIIFRVTSGTNADGVVFKTLLFDLTLMFGAGNEPSTVEEFKAMFPNDFYEYNAGELMSAGVTKVVSADADDAPIETINIPAEVQALTGYGIGTRGNCNYIDFETQKYYQYVGSRAYEAGDESDADVLTDGTTTHYLLDTPVETDISVSVDSLQCVSGGSLTFENQHNGDYNIPVPVEVQYIGV